MSRSREDYEKHEEEWKKNRFKQYSQEELDRIAQQDRERQEAQKLIDEQVKKCIEENPGFAYDEDAIKELEKAKKKREEERARYFDY